MVVIICAIITSEAILGYIVSEHYYQTTLQRAINVNSNFILTQAKALLSEKDFQPVDFDDKNKIFSEFFKGVDTTEILRIKVWSVDGTVVFSDDKSIIGKNFPDNEEFQEAMEGDVISEIQEPVKPENVEETGYGQLMEIYVPITSDDGKIIGIIETYTSMDLVNSSINDTIFMIFVIVITSCIFLIGAVVFVFNSIRKNVLEPITSIQNATKKVSSGDFELELEKKGDDEIKNLVDDINMMGKELAKQRKAIINVERLSAIGELSARIAHDMRNPLSIIKNSAQLIKMNQKYMDSNTKANWERLERGIYRISHQVDDVLEFIRPSLLKRAPARISAILHQACERLSIPENITINLPESDVTIPCDSDKLETVFVNLIMNSIQAIGNDVGTISITLKDESDNVLLITLKDTGPGIRAEILGKIFEPLFTTKQMGTGLGLPSCRNIIEKHGGSIDVSSSRGRGSTFLIRLPKTTEWQNISKIGDKEKLTDYITTNVQN
jgi:signal transduction histidine kinase